MDNKPPHKHVKMERNTFIQYVGDKPECYIPEYRRIVFRKGRKTLVPNSIAERILLMLPQEFKKTTKKKGDL